MGKRREQAFKEEEAHTACKQRDNPSSLVIREMQTFNWQMKKSNQMLVRM